MYISVYLDMAVRDWSAATIKAGRYRLTGSSLRSSDLTPTLKKDCKPCGISVEPGVLLDVLGHLPLMWGPHKVARGCNLDSGGGLVTGEALTTTGASQSIVIFTISSKYHLMYLF